MVAIVDPSKGLSYFSSYMYWHDVPRRIWKYNRHMKFVVLLRNPIDRAYSHWNMERARDVESLAFGDAIRQEQARCSLALPFQHRWYSYVDRGFYLAQIRRLWQFFPRSNVLVLKSEHLREEPDNCLANVCDFLGVDRLPKVGHRVVHSLPYRSQMSEDDRSYLRNLYEYEIRGIERVFNWDCTDWLL